MSKNNAHEINKLAKTVSKLLPGPDVHGDPFWTVMEIGANNIATGIYATVHDNKTVPLFFTQSSAEEYHLQLQGSSNTAVRGISRPHLLAMIKMWELGLLKIGLVSPKSSSSGFDLMLPENPEKFEALIRERYGN